MLKILLFWIKDTSYICIIYFKSFYPFSFTHEVSFLCSYYIKQCLYPAGKNGTMSRIYPILIPYFPFLMGFKRDKQKLIKPNRLITKKVQGPKWSPNKISFILRHLEQQTMVYMSIRRMHSKSVPVSPHMAMLHTWPLECLRGKANWQCGTVAINTLWCNFFLYFKGQGFWCWLHGAVQRPESLLFLAEWFY